MNEAPALAPILDAQALLAALKAGLAASVGAATPDPKAEFRVALEASVTDRLPPVEWKRLKAWAGAQDAGRGLAAAGDIIAARARSTEIWAELSAVKLSDLGYRIAKVFLMPVDAYFNYCAGAYSAARDGLLQASQIDAQLATSDGLPLFAVHRLQLAHNLMRIDTRRGALAPAAELGCILLEHILNRVEGPSEFVSSPQCLAGAPEKMLHYCYDKICAELAIVAADGAVSARRWPRSHAAPANTPKMRPLGRQWIAMALAARGKGLADFQERAVRLLAAGPCVVGTELWTATLLDVVNVLKRKGMAWEARTMAETALNNLQIPVAFKLRLQRKTSGSTSTGSAGLA